MKKITASLLMIVFIMACKKEISDNKLQPLIQEEQAKPPSPPANAKPAIAYRRSHSVSSQLSVPAIYVMDDNGDNQSVVYTNYSGKGNNLIVTSPDYPSWSPDGQQLCILLNKTDLYTFYVTVVNGTPGSSNVMKIADGVADGGAYSKAAWRPGSNAIASVWRPGTGPTSIRLIPSSGGAPSTLYTSPEDFTLNHPSTGSAESHLTFNQDGSLIAFFERQISTGGNFLRVLDMVSHTIVKNIGLNQFWAITGIDWANTPGSSVIGFSSEINGCVQVNAYHQLHTIDISVETPTSVFISNDKDDFSWSPDDSRVAFSGFSHAIVGNVCGARYYNGGVRTLTLSTNVVQYTENGMGYNPDWKK
jgi:hypothetical protein